MSRTDIDVLFAPKWPPMVTIKDDALLQFARRLNQALDDLNFPPKYQGRQLALSKAMHVSQKGARKWLEAEAFPTQEKQQELAKLLRVRFEWLMTGQGEKRVGSSIMAPVVNHRDDTLTVDEEVMLELYQNLSPENRKTLFRLAMRLRQNTEC